MNLFYNLFYIIFTYYVSRWNVCPYSMAPTNRYIRQEQWKNIQYLIQHPQTTEAMQSKIRYQIYLHYHHWADHKAYQFKRFHRHKCHAITLEELKMYSQRGLHQATQNYHGNASFLPYANAYVMGELYRGMTELHSITSIPKYIRRRHSHRNQTKRHKKQLNTHFVGENEWRLDKLSLKHSTAPYEDAWKHYCEKEKGQEKSYEIWNRLSQMEPIVQRIFQLKYGNVWEWGSGENRPVSNRKIGEVIGYSEEFVRKNIVKIKKHLLPLFSNTPLFS